MSSWPLHMISSTEPVGWGILEGHPPSGLDVGPLDRLPAKHFIFDHVDQLGLESYLLAERRLDRPGRSVTIDLDLFDRVHVDERAELDRILQAVANLRLGHSRAQLFGEGIIDAGLHIDAVRADAGLAVVAELGDHCAFDGLIEVGVVKDDEGRIAAKLHRAFHHLIRSLTQQDPPHFGRAGEGEFAHDRVLAEFLADVR